MATNKLGGTTASTSLKTANALNALKRQLASTASRTASTATRSAAPAASSTSRNAGFGTSSRASAPAPSSGTNKLSSTRSPGASAGYGSGASSASNLSSTSKQQVANQIAANTGGSTATPAGSTGGSSTPSGASGTQGNATSAFGKSFTPDSYQQMFSSPDALIRAWYDFNKLSPNGGELAMSQAANARNMLLLYTMFGAGNDNFTGGNGQFGPYADWSNQYLQQGRTPGAGYFSQDQILDRLFTDDQNDPMFTQLYGSNLLPGQQSNNWISAYETALSNTMAPEILNAHQARLDELEQQFIAQKAQGKHQGMNWGEYLQANGWG